jgi:hypothetical protein
MKTNVKRLVIVISIMLAVLVAIFFTIRIYAVPAGELAADLNKITWQEEGRLNFIKQCPDLSKERQLPDLGDSALNWVCYTIFDQSYLAGALGHGVLSNWVKENQAAYDTLHGKVKAWDDNAKKKLKETLEGLTEAERTLLVNYFRRIAIAAYVKDSSKMNGYLWSSDRWTEASKFELDTTEHKFGLRVWSVKALENAITSQPKQDVTTYRGKTMRSDTLEKLLEHFQKNSRVWEPAFVSTTKSRKIALGYTKISEDVNILFEITSSNSGGDLEIRQQEITFPPNTVFRVTADPEVLKNHKEVLELNNFVSNDCSPENKSQDKDNKLIFYCNATWKTLVIIKLREELGGRANLNAAEKEVEDICLDNEHFLEQCGEDEFIKKAEGKIQKLKRKFAGARIGDCTHQGRNYKCTTRSTEEKCMACVLCLEANGKVKARSCTRLHELSCKGRHASKDGFYFSDVGD